MSTTALTATDIRFINLVATRTFGSGPEPVEPNDLEAALGSLPDNSPFARAAALANELIAHRVFAAAPLPTVLVAISCQLDRDGAQLLAPQGAIVGMIRELAAGVIDVQTLERWLVDRAVPSSSTE